MVLSSVKLMETQPGQSCVIRPDQITTISDICYCGQTKYIRISANIFNFLLLNMGVSHENPVSVGFYRVAQQSDFLRATTEVISVFCSYFFTLKYKFHLKVNS